MATNSSTFTEASDIRDIAPPVDIPDPFAWLWWGLAALALVVAALLVLRWLRKRAAKPLAIPIIPADVRAKQKLQDALSLISQPKPFVIAVSDAARWYLEERFNFRAPERTTEEFLNDLQRTDRLTREQKESLGQFLTNCDLVKFAKYEPGETELRDLHASALRLIDETEPQTQPNQQPGMAKAFTQAGAAAYEASIDPSSNPATASSRGRTLAIIGTLLQLGPSIWIAAYVVMLFRLLILAKDLPQSASGKGFAALTNMYSQMISIYGNALVMVCAGILTGVVGLVLLTISLVSSRYRSEWFFWFLVIYGFLLLGAFPCVGTAVGLFFMVYCLTKRREFFAEK